MRRVEQPLWSRRGDEKNFTCISYKVVWLWQVACCGFRPNQFVQKYASRSKYNETFSLLFPDHCCWIRRYSLLAVAPEIALHCWMERPNGHRWRWRVSADNDGSVFLHKNKLSHDIKGKIHLVEFRSQRVISISCEWSHSICFQDCDISENPLIRVF